MKITIPIEEIYPGEPCVIKSSVQYHFKKYKSCKKVKPPTIAIIEGCYFVIEGTNRIFAAKKAGMTLIEVINDTPVDVARLENLRSFLNNAKRCEMKGFENIEEVDTLQQRADRYKSWY